jgi:hypothetical protein
MGAKKGYVGTENFRWQAPSSIAKAHSNEKWYQSFLRLPARVSPTVMGINLGDPMNLTGFEKPEKPPEVAAPPPPADTTASMLREISRAETDNQLRSSGRSMLYGGGKKR